MYRHSLFGTILHIPSSMPQSILHNMYQYIDFHNQYMLLCNQYKHLYNHFHTIHHSRFYNLYNILHRM